MLMFIFILTGCQKSSEKWVGFYYKNGIKDSVVGECDINEFETKEKCNEWGNKKTENNIQSDYYCGYKCNYDNSCQYACENNNIFCDDPSVFNKEEWYEELINKLVLENKIDSEGAKWLQMISSQSDVGSVDDVINREGKITKDDIIKICNFENEISSNVIVIARQKNDLNYFFNYDINLKKLKKVNIQGDYLRSIIINETEKIDFKEIKDDVIVFKTEDSNSKWEKLFYYNFKKNTIEHFQNCENKDNKKECKLIGEQEWSGYQEIETSFDTNAVEDFGFKEEVIKEKIRLENKGIKFSYNEDIKINESERMYYMEKEMECVNGKSDCKVVDVMAYKNNIPPEFVVKDCNEDDWCKIVDPKTSEIDFSKFKRITNVYGYGKDIYIVDEQDNNSTYHVYKNNELLFTHEMAYMVDLIKKASNVAGSPSFNFNELKSWKEDGSPVLVQNIWYKGNTINEQFEVNSSSYLFSFKDKIGFVAENNGQKAFYFNGKKVSKYFDEIRTTSCCATFAYPIRLDSNGILFFLAKRNEKYFFVEIDLNGYLE